MTTSVELSINPLTGILPEGDNNNKFRYYHCVLTTKADWICEERYKMTSPGEELNHSVKGIYPANITKCIPIRSSTPKILDPLILKYEITSKVEIKK